MIRARLLAVIGCLALLSVAMRATADGSRQCGFTPASSALSAFAPDVLSRRERLLSGGRACGARHPETVRYLRSILSRLVHGSHLDGFAQRLPKLTFVLDCSIPLPIAMATVGKIMSVPCALPKLAASEDAIATVLGHELAHLRLQHLEQRLGDILGPMAIVTSTKRELERMQEQEADRVGLDLAASAGYDPYAAIDHMRQTDAIARALQRSGKLRVQANEAVYGKLETRLGRLSAHIRDCGYRRPASRTAVASAVRAELAE